MPDITMCENKDCPLASRCYRRVAEPSSYSQSYAMFVPDDDENCSHFWDVDRYLDSSWHEEAYDEE
jgi:hypothetical protein